VQALKEKSFEDKEGEPVGSGEKRKEALQAKINSLMDKAKRLKASLESKEPLPNHTESISAKYIHPDKHIEPISISLEEKLTETLSLYKKTTLDLPPDFEDQMQEIWQNNLEEIEKAIEENGFDDILLLPGGIPLLELNTKMTVGYNPTHEGSNFKAGGSFAGAKSQNTDKPRLVLVHKTQNLADRPELKATFNIKGQYVKQDQILTLEDYLVFQRKYFEETGKHLDVAGWTWLATTSGTRLVSASWNPGTTQVDVDADDLDYQAAYLGARPARSFF